VQPKIIDPPLTNHDCPKTSQSAAEMTKDGIGHNRKSLRSSECSRAPRLFCEEYVICLLINIFKYDSDRKVIKQCIVREIWGWDGGLNMDRISGHTPGGGMQPHKIHSEGSKID